MNLIKKKFQDHYNYYLNVGVETAQQQAGNLQQVSSDYQGRVLYELLQNAFDKAKHKILVEVKNNTLYVANDGDKFTFNSDFDYKKGNSKRCDFESLCSISTSSKINADSIGNKGVGFKSVFSVATDGLVKIHTQGQIQGHEKTHAKNISFSMCDVFTSTDSIQEEFPKEVQKYLIMNISAVQSERFERGVPGFYFPFLIRKIDDTINGYFSDGYVTVIEIPFDNETLIQELIEEVKKIHFKFVSLKHKKEFAINFKSEVTSFDQKVSNQEMGLITVEIEYGIIEDLAEKAGVKIAQKNSVGIYFRSQPDGLLYNYLPTQKPSPFPYVDFHADFHTTVDRRSIDFSSSTAIGKYNCALLDCCIELYFYSLTGYLKDRDHPHINLNLINKETVSGKLMSFDWNYLMPNDSFKVFHKVVSILSIGDWNYYHGARFFSLIALKYFKTERSNKNYTDFYKNISAFLELYVSKTSQYYIWVERFKKELGSQLRTLEVQLLPGFQLKKEDEILFRDSGIEMRALPSFLGINITSFNIEDKHLRQYLNIKDFSDNYPILRYFRQVSIDGQTSKDSISEKEQIYLLQCLFELYGKRRDNDSFVDRYQRFINDKIRADSSAQNNANFSVSTLFLKTKAGNYKPAQLCYFHELDKKFLHQIIGEAKIEDLEGFIQFLGVSPERNYLVVEKPIYDKLNKGLDFVPTTLQKDTTEKLRGNKILPDVRIVFKKSEIHPALVNYNRYPFLTDITNTRIREELNPLKIGRYSEFPKVFSEVLITHLENNITKYPEHVFRLYANNLFKLLHRNKKYLTIKNDNYSLTSNTDFKIASNKDEYELLKTKSVNLLCHFNANEIDVPHFQHKKVKLKLKEIKVEGKNLDDTITFKQIIYPYVPYLLIEISKMPHSTSERDYLHKGSDIQKFQKDFNRIKVKICDKLTTIWSFGDEDNLIERNQPYYWNQTENTIYYESLLSKRNFAELVAQYVFKISALSDKIELFFGKEIEEIDLSFDELDIEQINKFWLPDYIEKFKSFQKEIIQPFKKYYKYQKEEQWNIYNEHHQPDFLIDISNAGLIPELQQKINEVKSKKEYQEYFKGFELRITRTHIEKKIGRLKAILHSKDPNSGFISELVRLQTELGVENRIDEIEKEVACQFPNSSSNGTIRGNTIKEEKEINLKNKINSIYTKFAKKASKDINEHNLDGAILTEVQLTKKKKVIYKGNHGRASETELSALGATGEEEVLIHFINKFLEITDIQERQNGIEAVYKLIQTFVSDTLFDKLRDNCLACVDDDNALKKALIPFLYTTMHFKYSNFDLVALDRGKAILVEVKTTDKKSFIMSVSEVLRARSSDNYVIVRVTSNALEILGNPVKQFEVYINKVISDKISMKPRNYEVTIK